jgi:Ca2+-binding EF-hand superfamily protein
MKQKEKKPMTTRGAKRLSFLLALPLTLSFAGVVSAQGRGPGTHGPGKASPAQVEKMKQCHAKKRAKRIQKFDTDGDKKLSQAEREIARATKKAERLGQYDKDKDGSLSKAEKADLIHDKITKRFEHIDSNGDAEISKAEAQASCSPLGPHFERVDSDGNKSISWTEFEKVARKMMKRMRHRRAGKRGGKFRHARGHGGGGAS